MARAIFLLTSIFVALVCAPALAAPTVVSLTFDDGRANQTRAVDALARHGLPATFYVNSGHVGRSGFLGWKQLRRMQQAGHEIGGHTRTHRWLPPESWGTQWDQVCGDRNELRRRGFAAMSFAYPYGGASEQAKQVVRQCGYTSARGLGGLRAFDCETWCAPFETLPPHDRWYVRSTRDVRTDTSLAELQRYVTQAEQNGGGWVPIVFHQVCQWCDLYSVDEAKLRTFLGWLASRRSIGTTVATVGSVMARV